MSRIAGIALVTIFAFAAAVGFAQVTTSPPSGTTPTLPGAATTPGSWDPSMPSLTPVPTLPPPTGVSTPRNLAGRITMQLTDGSSLVGTVEEPSSWKLTTDFGEVVLAADKLVCVHVSVNGAAAHFWLTNGDSISGKLNLDKVRFKTQWGEVSVAAKYLLSLGNPGDARPLCLPCYPPYIPTSTTPVPSPEPPAPSTYTPASIAPVPNTSPAAPSAR